MLLKIEIITFLHVVFNRDWMKQCRSCVWRETWHKTATVLQVRPSICSDCPVPKYGNTTLGWNLIEIVLNLSMTCSVIEKLWCWWKDCRWKDWITETVAPVLVWDLDIRFVLWILAISNWSVLYNDAKL